MPRSTLTREQIVDAAVRLLDEEGLEGLNMRALGKRLGSAATAVYWHVGSKADLISLAGDQVWSAIPLPDPEAVPWRAAATAMAADLHATLVRHPWLVQAFGAYLMFGPGKAGYDDRSLAVHEAAGFVGQEADRAAAAVFTYVLGNALGPAAAASLERGLEGEPEGGSLAEGMARATEVASRFPRLRARLETAAATGYAEAPDDSFAFGLRAILDGLEARLALADGTR
ncbi:TetR/AcrR family transcriptional regulator [Streptacidiphilus rugosus]|uniref:TetR/AcrR family transcriptional regulator n=1 Tax=Streptacidiphilus rugosus TaxID=405783 RepID=UPI00055C8454|nr:TetR/AcrR family transcriptional regulator [Streptacidiphilus rugosus]